MADEIKQDDTAVIPKPESMNGWEYKGAFTGNTGTKALVKIMKDDAMLFTYSVNLTDERNVRKWIGILADSENVSAEEKEYILSSNSNVPRNLQTLLSSLLDLRNKEKEEKDNPPVSEADAEPGPCEVSLAILADTPKELKAVATKRLHSPDLLQGIQEDLATAVAGEKRLVTLAYLHCISRLMPKPIHLIVVGASSSGKSYTLQQVIRYAPDECVMRANAITPNALFHLDPNFLRHRIVAGGERKRDQTDANADGTRILREMLADQRISKAITLSMNGEMVTEHIEKEGPIAYSETTTVAQVDPEDANRCIIIHTDESQEQTIRIMEASDAKDLGETPQGEVAEQMRQEHHTMQRMLQRANVVIPYVRHVSREIQGAVKHNLEIRRAWDLVKGVIRASALLHQYQRERDDDGNILANLDDYSTARWVLSPWLGEIIEGQSTDAARECLNRILAKYNVDETFTVRDLAENKIGGESQLRKQWLPALEDADVIEVTANVPGAFDGRGRKAKQWTLKRADLKLEKRTVLPKADRIRYLMGNPEMLPPVGGRMTDAAPVVETTTVDGHQYRHSPNGTSTAIVANGEAPQSMFE